MQFRLTVPFTTWTQNTILRPADLPDIVHEAAETTGGVWGFITGIATCGPICGVVGAIAGEELGQEVAQAIESAYDGEVKNTVADNIERVGLIVNQIQIEDYDIVALQEVDHFDSSIDPLPQSVTNLRNSLSGSYHLLDGPPPAGVEINSGLLTLVKRSLASSPQFQHNAQTFASVTGQPVDDLAVQGFDALAQKGFTLDTVQFGSDANDFVYVVNTHMQASKGATEDAIRMDQLQQMQNFVSSNTDLAHPIIYMGDFNIVEAILDTDMLRHTCRYHAVAGCFNSDLGLLNILGPNQGLLNILGLNPGDDMYRSTWTFQEKEGFTVDTSRNAYASAWAAPGAGEQERLDYVLVRQGSVYQLEVDIINMTDQPVVTQMCQSSGWGSTGNPNPGCYLSDHYGISSELRLVKP